MKNKLFLSALLAACVTCVAQAVEISDLTVSKTETKTIEGDLATNRLTIAGGNSTDAKGGTLIVNGNTTIVSNLTSGNGSQLQMGSTLETESVEFISETANEIRRGFTIFGTIKTNNFKVSAAEGSSAQVHLTSGGGCIQSSGTEKGTFEVGKNAELLIGNPTKSAAGSIKNMNTVINGGTLNVKYYATMDGITLNSGAINIINTYDPFWGSKPIEGTIDLGDITVENGTLTLEEAAITSGITMNSGTLQFLGDCQTGDLILNGGTIYFGESAVTLSEEGLASTVTTVTTGAMTLNSGTIYVADNYVIDLRGEALILTENVNIVMSVASLDNAEGLTVFAEAGNVEGLDKLSVTLVDETGTEKEMAVSYNSDGSVVTSTIPEPTTATLSLLALAALAARRRRASR
ncbi:MAG: hypothetical protein IKZ13_09970 [Akkermansia sp.]|nr:hypothetical protein [Akkermansia sp.]